MTLQSVILGLLTYQAMTGYDLKNLHGQSINFIGSAHLSQIYRELGTLEKKRFVTSQTVPQHDRPNKRIYTITKEGRENFEKQLKKFPLTLLATLRDEFALRIFFGVNLSNEELIFQLHKYVKERKNEVDSFGSIEECMENYGKRIGVTNENFYWSMILKRGYMLNQAYIKWAEECISELKE
ncbi:PadR family transcriptional regulator [Clostridium sp. FP2]|uniref:PadR family transcriptional regulator n=1 Tax=Clostridium sp. FP2 TaxID=2724481 RepID=UPI0013E987F6|nr:PadR family transcriptional regulator [Clostridium sp. FP2]MBZ9625584.1 PadR family transcriptional regulator [Clostridium sp. FP2]